MIDKEKIFLEIVKKSSGNDLNSKFDLKSNAELLKKAKKYLKLISFLPYLRMAGVCNNVAFNIADENSDIDLFIVTDRNRLFLCRSLLTGLFQILGLRRYGTKIKGRFCLSFFITEDNLDLSAIALKPKDIYLAHWIKSLIPIIDQNIYTKFMKENQNFLKDYFKNEIKNTHECVEQGIISKKIKNGLEIIFNTSFGDFIENKLKKWQLKRANIKKEKLDDNSGIVISEKMLKFHNVDRRKVIQEIFDQMNSIGVP
jgi:hypothetical protein